MLEPLLGAVLLLCWFMNVRVDFRTCPTLAAAAPPATCTPPTQSCPAQTTLPVVFTACEYTVLLTGFTESVARSNNWYAGSER